ncbi:TonB-dependent receptor [Oceanicoccus sp. KOV_DT_Chl]|uniref:TonB-dependent receptor n=1 Tax=Oceanicoccus sp. KOV_DT_Chl TaxID=1904639 RepID=UPI001356A5C6|nr:TonB-dependent receptor [Oceanicoccus sp. KOV_DT_Chl]
MKKPEFTQPSLLAIAIASTIVTSPLMNSAVVAAPVLEEVIVSARKKEDLAQTAPISVALLDSTTLEKGRIEDMLEVVNRVPGFTMNAENVMEPNVFIRGIGTDIESAAANSSIGVFVDNVYMARSMAFAMDIFDLERVEVLRGPQGTLYGKNVVGGVINFITAKPTEQQDGMFEVGRGSYNSINSKGFVSGPITDKLTARLSASSRSHDGYAKNTYTGKDIEDMNADGLRLQLHYQANDELGYLLNLDESRRRGTGKWTDMAVPSSNNLPFKNDDPRRGPNNIDGVSEADVSGGSLHVNWSADDWTLTSITSARHGDFKQTGNDGGSFIDFSLIPTDFTTGRVDFFSPDYDPSTFNDDYFVNDKMEEVETYSQEFTYATEKETSLNYMLGVFYMVEEINRLEGQDYLFGQFYAQGFESSATQSENTTFGAFVELTYDFTDSVSATMGLRYTKDDKDFDVARFNSGDFLGPDFEDAGGNPTKEFSAADSDSWSDVNPSLTINWEANEDVFFYATYSEGFKSGGWNGENATSPQEAAQGYDEEFATNFEIGAKSTLFDRRLQLNATVFHTEYEDLQTQQFIVYNPSLPADNVIANAGEAEVEGLELDMNAALAEWWTLSISYAYMDAAITGDLISTDLQYDPNCFCSVPVPSNLKGNELRRAPEHSYNIASYWDWSLQSGASVNATLNYSWSDDYFNDNENNPNTVMESFGVIDANVSYITADGQWQATVWGKNLNNELYESGINEVIGSVLVSYAPPRTAGVSIKWMMPD